MSFGQRLDLLIKITDASNQTLARFVSLDPSYVSRLRNELRPLAKKEEYSQMMAVFFAQQSSESHKQASLAELLGVKKELLEEEIRRRELIHNWLIASEQGISKGSRSGKKEHRTAGTAENIGNASRTRGLGEKEIMSKVYYGQKGKQEAVLKFLQMVIEEKALQTLFLFSDENMSWLLESKEFAQKWTKMLLQVLQKGCRVKVIHTVNRTIDELRAGFEKWLPLYLTGGVEPFYYPKTRDGLFKRTIFIAPSTAAVVANSVGDKIKNTANLLVEDRKLLAALLLEYEELLRLCRPLMRIFQPKNKLSYIPAISQIEEAIADSLYFSTYFSHYTIPPDVAKEVFASLPHPLRAIFTDYQQKRQDGLASMIKKHRFTEVIQLPQNIPDEGIEMTYSFPYMALPLRLCFSRPHIVRHLQNVIKLLEKHPNYRVVFAQKENKLPVSIFIKEDTGVIMGKNYIPDCLFIFKESHLVGSFWVDFQQWMEQEAVAAPDKKGTIVRLHELIASLSKN